VRLSHVYIVRIRIFVRSCVRGPILGRMSLDAGQPERWIAGCRNREIFQIFGGDERVVGVEPFAVDGFREAVGRARDVTGRAAVAAGNARSAAADALLLSFGRQ